MYIIRGTKRTNDEQRTQGEKKERKKNGNRIKFNEQNLYL